MSDFVEIWKEIPGHSEYEASNLGRVRSKDRVKTVINHPVCGTHKRKYKGQILSPKPSNIGYSRYDLGNKKLVLGHRAVFSAFYGAIKTGNVINHINHNRADNRIENLESITQAENIKHDFVCGKKKNPVTKEELFSKEDVNAIRFFYDTESTKPGIKNILAKIFKTRRERLRRVASRETYWWIK